MTAHSVAFARLPPVLNTPTSVDDINRSRRVGGRSEVDHQVRDLLRPADSADGLPRDKRRPRLFVITLRPQAIVQGGSLDRAGADGITTNSAADVIGRNRLRQADHRGLRRAVNESRWNAFHATRYRGHVDDGPVA